MFFRLPDEKPTPYVADDEWMGLKSATKSLRRFKPSAASTPLPGPIYTSATLPDNGPLPPGYRAVTRESDGHSVIDIVIHPAEARIVRSIFSRFAVDDESLFEIASWLSEQAQPVPPNDGTERSWVLDVLDTLRDERYVERWPDTRWGYIWGDDTDVCAPQHLLVRDDLVVVEDRSVWLAAQLRLERKGA